jgi:hypothetical protein
MYGFKTFEELDRDFGVPSSNEYHFYAAIDLTKYRNPFTRKKKAKPSRRTTTSGRKVNKKKNNTNYPLNEIKYYLKSLKT